MEPKAFEYLQIVRYLFLEYASEKGLTTDDLARVHIKRFARWIKRKRLPFTNEEKDLFRERLGATDEVIETAERALGDSFGSFSILHRLRYILGLSGRPVPNSIPESVTLSLSITANGQTKILEMRAEPESLDKITDGQLCGLLDYFSTSMVNMVAETGLDKLMAAD